MGPIAGALIMNAPVTLPSKAQAVHDRAWWATESERTGTDWQSLGPVLARIITHLSPCPTCGGMPCVNPSFCETCRQQDHERTSPMTFDNTNRGVLFNERDRKTEDNDRDYGGRINIEGRDYWLSAWLKTSKKGNKFLSLSVKAMESQRAEEGDRPEFNDRIPF
jgi:hypothetical protein